MIDRLRLSGLGVIDQATLELDPGLTVLSGETGAGKTMVLTSLRLLLGEKGDAALVREGHRQIEVDGVVAIPQHLRGELEELGLDPQIDELIVSRTVPAEGRSRAVLDGRPVPLRTLAEITGRLVIVHGQADQWRVRRGTVQMEMLDEFAGPEHARLLEEYSRAWTDAVRRKKALDRLHADFGQRQVEIQYLGEITAAIRDFDPRMGEENEIDQEIDRLANVAELREAVEAAARDVNGTDGFDGGTDMLGKAAARLQSASRYDESLAALSQRLLGALADATEVGEELRDYRERLLDDPAQLAALHQRRADLDTLLKGRANTTEELLRWCADATERLDELTGGESDPEQAAKQLEKAQELVLRWGRKLSESRRAAAAVLEEAVERELSALAMASAQFRIALTGTKPTARGLEEVSMELKPRPDAPFRPLGDGASGGELSRILLALEVAMGEKSKPATFVFDEVDAGVGGRTATEVGRRLAALARGQQVLVVTHLPQVAAFADRQLVVSREDNRTTVHEVSGEERVREIVRMLGGEEDSVAARRHALELLEAGSWHNDGNV